MTLRWHAGYRDRLENPAVDAFLAEILQVCEKHQMSISHEDFGGSFNIKPFNQNDAEWLKEAGSFVAPPANVKVLEEFMVEFLVFPFEHDTQTPIHRFNLREYLNIPELTRCIRITQIELTDAHQRLPQVLTGIERWQLRGDHVARRIHGRCPYRGRTHIRTRDTVQAHLHPQA
jgi:hypothetical protein